MSRSALRTGMDYATYLAFEEANDLRHELVDGEVFAMTGARMPHNAIAANLVAEVHGALRGGPCRPFTSDQRVRVDEATAFYPDLTVVCGRPEPAPGDPNAIANPAVAFEVLSPSTEAWDRGGKFERLQRLPSLHTYVLVHPDRPRVEVFARNPDGSWTVTAYGPGQAAGLGALAVTIPVDGLYEGLEDLWAAEREVNP